MKEREGKGEGKAERDRREGRKGKEGRKKEAKKKGRKPQVLKSIGFFPPNSYTMKCERQKKKNYV